MKKPTTTKQKLIIDPKSRLKDLDVKDLDKVTGGGYIPKVVDPSR